MSSHNHGGYRQGISSGEPSAEHSEAAPPSRIHPRTGQAIAATVHQFERDGIKFTVTTYEAPNGDAIGDSILSWTDRDGRPHTLSCASRNHAIIVAGVISGKG